MRRMWLLDLLFGSSPIGWLVEAAGWRRLVGEPREGPGDWEVDVGVGENVLDC